MKIHVCLAFAGMLLSSSVSVAADAVRDAFETPPLTARPLVWWNWERGLIDKTALLNELRALKEQGFGGAQIYDWDTPGQSNAWGDVEFNSPAWKEAVALVSHEAEKLGLEIGLNHNSGWTATSGPWVTAEDAMKLLMVRSVEVTGPKAFDGKLPDLVRPEYRQRDVRVLACPVPPVELRDRTRFAVTSTVTDDAARLARLGSGRYDCNLSLSHDPALKNVFEFTAPEPETVAAVECNLAGSYVPHGWPGSRLELLYEHAPNKWQSVLSVGLRYSGPGCSIDTPRHFGIRPVRSRRFRVIIHPLKREIEGRPLSCRLGGLRLCSFRGVSFLSVKTLAARADVPDDAADTADGGVDASLARGAVLDLTDRMSSDGRLRWQVPAGTWRVLRCGYVESPRRNIWASPSQRGRLCDVMEKKGVRTHYAAFLEPLVELAYGKDRRFRTTGLTHAVVDSFEGGFQTWGDGFEEAFRERNGYAFATYLPVFAGCVVGSPAESERALWDYRNTAAALVSENYGKALWEESNRLGLQLYLEGVGDGNVDTLDYSVGCDVPMCEFWMKNPAHRSVRQIASAAHLSGRSLVASEAFTSGPENLGWGHDALKLKIASDFAFSVGVNRFVYHCFMHNPYPHNFVPGIRVGQWGTQMEPTQTWWKYAGDTIIGYQNRVGAVLQSGRQVVDVLVFTGENQPNAPREPDLAVREGFRADFINRSFVLKLAVRDGDLVLPCGARYRLLVLRKRHCRALTPELMEKLVALAKGGARIVMEDLPVRSPSLRGYPACDDRVRSLAAELKPLVFAATADAAFDRMKIRPDFLADAGDLLRWNHATHADGSESYFVSGTNSAATIRTVNFRAKGRAVELWDAETGEIFSLPGRPENGGTAVEIPFKPVGSAFVFFRPQPTAGAKALWKGREVAAAEAKANWKVTFPTGWYYGEPETKTVEMDRPVDWTTLDDGDLRHFSGTATYAATLDAPQPKDGERVFLDFGEVGNFAVVTVGARTYPVLWRPPYRVDVTEAVRRAPGGKLAVSAKVTNLWVNRLIGDEALPSDLEWNDNGTLARFPDWVRKGGKSPTGRHTFLSYGKLITKDLPLLPSGVKGPVRFVTEAPAE